MTLWQDIHIKYTTLKRSLKIGLLRGHSSENNLSTSQEIHYIKPEVSPSSNAFVVSPRPQPAASTLHPDTALLSDYDSLSLIHTQITQVLKNVIKRQLFTMRICQSLDQNSTRGPLLFGFQLLLTQDYFCYLRLPYYFKERDCLPQGLETETMRVHRKKTCDFCVVQFTSPSALKVIVCVLLI
jgi:hypothetical protein